MLNKIIKALDSVIIWGGLIASIGAAILLGSFAIYLIGWLIVAII